MLNFWFSIWVLRKAHVGLPIGRQSRPQLQIAQLLGNIAFCARIFGVRRTNGKRDRQTDPLRKAVLAIASGGLTRSSAVTDRPHGYKQTSLQHCKHRLPKTIPEGLLCLVLLPYLDPELNRFINNFWQRLRHKFAWQSEGKIFPTLLYPTSVECIRRLHQETIIISIYAIWRP